MKQFIMTRPDDWHVHFRDDAALKDTVSASASHFARALVMPNLKPALTTVEQLNAYRARIQAYNQSEQFSPYMTLYLNEQVSIEEIEAAKHDPYILGAKLYPAGATTHSEQGAKSIQALYPQLAAMEQNNLVLQIHGEVTHGDIFEREKIFIESYLQHICSRFPKLRIVLEHISTAAAVEFISNASQNVAATITPHHLLFNRNQLLAGGIKPHYYCLPILKSEQDRKALQQAAVSGNPKFFAGTDSAPHARSHKESACGCAGIYTAPYAVSMYAEVFDRADHLNKLNDFLSRFGAEFYQLPISSEEIELVKKPQIIPNILPFGNEQVVPGGAGMTLSWSIYE